MDEHLIAEEVAAMARLREPHGDVAEPEDPFCALCNHGGWFRSQDGKGLVPCACRISWETPLRRERYVELSTIDGRCHLGAFVEDRAFAPIAAQYVAHTTARRYASNPSGFLLLVGEPGTGKCARAARGGGPATRRMQPVFLRTRPYLMALKASMGMGDRYAELLRRATRSDLLILDDIGAGRGTDFEADTIDQILDERSEFALPTVITSNHPVGTSRQEGSISRDERIISRLASRQNTIVYLSGTDLRQGALPEPMAPDQAPSWSKAPESPYHVAGQTMLCRVCGSRPHHPRCPRAEVRR